MDDKPLHPMTRKELVDLASSLLQELVQHRDSAKKLVAELQGLMDTASGLSVEMQQHRDSVKTLEAQVQGHRDTASNLSSEAQKHRDSAQSGAAEAQGHRDTAGSLSAEAQKHRDTALNLAAEAEGHRDVASNISAEVQNLRDGASNLSEEAQAKRDEAVNLSAEIKGQQQSASDLVTKLKAQEAAGSKHATAMQKHRDDAAALSKQVAAQLENATASMEADASKRADLLDAIEELLPGATSAELATSYQEAKEQRAKVKGLWCGFVGALVCLAVGGFFVFYDQSDLTWEYILRLPMAVPFAWLAWYCQTRISQIERIKEEYHHKERVMRVFNGFSKEIEKLSKEDGSSQHLLDLIDMVTKAIARNPAEVVEPSERMWDSARGRARKDQKQGESPPLGVL